MDKIKLLIEKYDLSEDMANKVLRAIMQDKGFDMANQVYPAKDNILEISAIKNAGKKYVERSEQFDKNSIIIAMNPPGIKKVKFWLSDGRQITIDDPNFCGLLGMIIHETEFYPSKKRNKGNQPNQPYLKDIAHELMEYFSGSKYSKRAKIGRIFAEFLPRFENCNDKPECLQKEVDNILNKKSEN